MRLQIAADEVHIWHLLAEQVPSLAPLRSLLSPADEIQMNRYGQERDRLAHLLSRAMMRTVLAGYLGCDCADVQFVANPHGKPILQSAAVEPPLHFNLTHSRGAVALAVSANREVGIDIEERHRSVEYRQLAARYFTPQEAVHLQRLDGDQLREAFFAIWTLKEAFVKAIGRGLTFPLDAFCFELENDRLLRFLPLVDEVTTEWHFAQFDIGARHRGALAVECPMGCDVHVVMRDWAAVFV